MKIVAADVYRYTLPLNRPLTIRNQPLAQREGLILHLRADTGEEGLGEIAPLPGFSRETLDEAADQLNTLKSDLVGATVPRNLAAFDMVLDSAAPSVQFGIESAVLHLSAHAQGTTLHQLLSQTTPSPVRVAGLLSGPAGQIQAQARELLAAGFTEFKVKVGGDVDEAARKVRAVNEVVYGKALVHADANQAWDLKEAVAFGQAVGIDAVTYVEEPLKTIEGIPEFFDQTLIPVALDESLASCTVETIKSVSGVEILVLKPTVLGGIGKTAQLIKEAEQRAMNVVISSSFESSLGILTLAHLTGLPAHGHPAGLDTLKYFAQDILTVPVTSSGGVIDLTGYGSGSNDINFEVLTKLK